MTQQLDLDMWNPPEAPVDLPYQVLERQPEHGRSWFILLRRMVARRAPHE